MSDSPVGINATLREVLNRLVDSPHGICVVVDEGGRLAGVLTDGDCRRALLKGMTLDSPAKDAMQTQFFAVDESFSLDQIRLLMRTNKIEQVPIVDNDQRFLRIVSQRALLGQTPDRTNPVLILAGGKGRRLGPLTQNTPKPMLPIGGRPMLENLIVRLAEAKFGNIFISVNYLGHKIEEYFGDGSRWGCHVQYVREDMELGSGGPLKLLEGRVTEPFLVVNGDLVTTVDFGALLDFHNTGHFDLTLGVSTYEMQIPFGVVAARDDGVVESITEKPTHWCPINAGVYVVEPKILPMVPARQFLPMTTIVQTAMESGARVGAFMIHEVWNDVGLPAIYGSLAAGSNRVSGQKQG